jgi:hypothetical protein
MDCQTCQANLADYVHLELTGQAAELTYPEIAFHVETCAKCEIAYYREFRRQGQAKSLVQLQQIGQRSQVATVMQQITLPAVSEPAPDPSWYEVALEQGRAWLEKETGRWRRLWIPLASLGSTLIRDESPPRTPALAGLMGAEASATPILGTTEIVPPAGDFEIKLMVMADSATTDADLCQVHVAISLKNRFGDFSGLGVTLYWGDSAHTRETDALGLVSFKGLPVQQLESMSLMVSLVTD